MDVLTHALLTRFVVDRSGTTILAGVGPDIAFHLTYPPWVLAQGKAFHALSMSDWPDPPEWMESLHHACHSVPVALAGAVAIRVLTGQWPRRALAAWLLHILVDIATHSRRFWGPRFLWPLRDFAVDGVPWAETSSLGLSALIRSSRKIRESLRK